MNRRKILQVSYGGLGKGGVQAVLMGIVRELHEDFDFDVLIFTDGLGYYESEFSQYGRIFRIPCDKTGKIIRDAFEKISRPLRIFLKAYKILRQNHYAVVHCHNEFEGGLVLLAARLANVPIRIAHAHNTASPKKKRLPVAVYKWCLRHFVLMNSTVKVGCSRRANEYIFGKTAKNAKVINNAIDLLEFDRNKYQVESRHDEVIRFIHIGRYCYQKNQLFLLEIFERINSKLPNSVLNMIGFGEDERVIRSKIAELNLQEAVNLLPSSSNIPELLAESDYLVFPSRFEGLGIVVLEAQAMGVKCFVSTAVPPEANMGLCTYLSLDIGVKGWAESIIDFIERSHGCTPEVSSSMLKQYDIGEIAKQYEEIYER